jgi:DNA primase
MPGIDFREARAQVRIGEVLDLIGFEPRRVLGAQARGPCPVHRSRRASSRVFAVHLTKNAYRCFACGAKGNALDLWAACTRQSFYAAVVDLYQRLGRDIPWLSAVRRPTAAALSVYRESTNEESDPMPDP